MIKIGKMQGTGNRQDGKDAHIFINGDRRGMLSSIVTGTGPFGSDAPFRVVSYVVELWDSDFNEIARGVWDIRAVRGGWIQDTDKILMKPAAAKRQIRAWIAEQISP